MSTSPAHLLAFALFLGSSVSAAPGEALGLHLQCGSSADCMTVQGQEVTFERAPRLVLDSTTIAALSVSPDDPAAPGAHQVKINLKTEAGQKFFDLTTNNLGKRLAVMVGDHLVNAPEIKMPIESGEFVLALTPESYEKVSALSWFGPLVQASDKTAYQRKMLFLGLGVLTVVAGALFFRKRSQATG